MDTDAITGCICVSIKIRHPNEFCTGFQISKNTRRLILIFYARH